MNQTLHTRRGNKELHTGDLPIGQRSSIILNDDPLDHENIVLPVQGTDFLDYAATLAFAEEPIKILVQKNGEKNAPRTADGWVNGKGIECFINGQWLAMGFIPVGIPVIIKRKYAEVLARSKVDNVSTSHGSMNDENPHNAVDFSTSSKCPFTVIHDANPAGVEWLSKLMLEG